MGANPRTKGQTGERDIADDLNAVLRELYLELKLEYPAKPIVQRNQNQSAVGGCDLVNTYGMAIEVKRQEQLSINTWWTQCVKSAQERSEAPVLLFRQNASPGKRTQWRCILEVEVAMPASYASPMKMRAEVPYDDFKKLFKEWARLHVNSEFPHTAIKVAQPFEQIFEEILDAPVRFRHPSLFEDAL